jgi:hypothetical protein
VLVALLEFQRHFFERLLVFFRVHKCGGDVMPNSINITKSAA